jgi:hypothetical protein
MIIMRTAQRGLLSSANNMLFTYMYIYINLRIQTYFLFVYILLA